MMKYIKLTVVFVALTSGLYGQNFSKLRHNWQAPEPSVVVPDTFANIGLIGIKSDLVITNEYSLTPKFEVYSDYTLKQRIKILNKKGIEELTKFQIYEFENVDLITLDARTIKKDGSTLEVKSENIKKTRIYDNERNEYNTTYKFVIPGAEVGDDIEIIHSIRKRDFFYSIDLYLNYEIPYLKSNITLNNAIGIVYDIYNHNGMVTPEKSDYKYKTIFKWSAENLTPMGNEKFSITENEFPFARFIIDRFFASGMSREITLKPSSWSDYYESGNDRIYNNPMKTKGLDKYVESFKSQIDSLSSLEKVSFFVEMFNNEFKVNPSFDDKDMYIPFKEMLKRKEIDQYTLRKIYPFIFFHLQIPYKINLVKNRYTGELSPDEICNSQIDDYFYSFKDINNIEHFVYPASSNRKAHVDELPYQYEDSKIIVLEKKNPYLHEKLTEGVSYVSHLDKSYNKRIIRSHYKIEDDGQIKVNTKGNYAGMISYVLRSEWQKILKDYDKKKVNKWLTEEDSTTFSLDTLFEEESVAVPPFNYKYLLKNEFGESITEVGPNINELKFRLLPGHFLFGFSKEVRTTTACLPFGYTDEVDLFIEFPKPISILNDLDLNKTIENEIGSYVIKLTQVSPTIYKLNSTFQLNQNIVSSGKYPLYLTLCEMAKGNEELSINFKYTK